MSDPFHIEIDILDNGETHIHYLGQVIMFEKLENAQATVFDMIARIHHDCQSAVRMGYKRVATTISE